MSEDFNPTLADRDPAFRDYYRRHLQPLEARYETLRQSAVGERNRRIIAVAVAWIGSLAGLGWLAQRHGPLGDVWIMFGALGFFAVVGLGIWAYLPAGAHSLRLQDQILSRIVPFFGDLVYRQSPKLSPGSFNDWLILPRYSEAKGQDEIQGRYRGVPLQLAEFKLEYTYRSGTGSSSSNSTAIAFRGFVIALELDREHPGVTLARSRGSDMKRRFHLDESLKPAGSGSGMELFATEGAPGPEVMDERFLQGLAAISRRFEAKQLFASLHGNRLVLLIEHKGDYFEMSHREATDFVRDADRIRDQLERLFSIVDQLGLKGPEDAEVGVAEADTRPDKDEEYHVGGWGCFHVFVLFALCMGAFLWVLDPKLDPGARLGWSFLGGFLGGIGVFQLRPGEDRGLVGRLFWSALFLGGAYAVYHFFGPA